jgi:hypothetical protein
MTEDRKQITEKREKGYGRREGAFSPLCEVYLCLAAFARVDA